MSVSVTVTVKVEDQQYEAGTKHTVILEESAHASSTGTFAKIPLPFIGYLLEGAIDRAKRAVNEKLIAIKGEPDTPQHKSKG